MRSYIVIALLFLLIGSSLAGKEGIAIELSRGKLELSRKDILINVRGDSRIVTEKGRSCLSVYTPGKVPSKKRPSGMQAAKLYPAFAPKGAFRMEIGFRMDPVDYAKAQSFAVLFDSKNIHYPSKKPDHNRGMVIAFVRDSYLPMYVPQVTFGFGKKSRSISGRHIPADDKEHTLLLEYIPGGRGRLLLDGKENIDFELPAQVPASPFFAAAIGDRCTAPYFPFPGKITRFRLTPIKTPVLEILPKGRRAFYRNEKDAFLTLQLRNLGKRELASVTLSGTFGGCTLPSRKVAKLAPGKDVTLQLPLVTKLQKGSYKLKLQAAYQLNGKNSTRTLQEELFIAPLPHDRMPAFIWGYGHWDYSLARKIGFTHTVEWHASHVYVRNKANPDDLNTLYYRYLDDMLMQGMGMWDLFHAANMHKKYPRISREGTPYKTSHPNMDATDPRGVKETLEVAKKVAKAYKDHPGYEGTLLNSEIRDNSRPSFAPHQLKAYRAKFGVDIPLEVFGRSAPHYNNIKDFPFDRIVDEKDPLLTYYTWFWKEGDGWNPLHSKLNDVFKSYIRRPSYKTMYDPAVRVPPIWGNGGKVDILSHWTYAYPDPIRVPVSTEENMAMARGGRQDLFNMTQLICYRSRTAPQGKKLAKHPSWTKDSPKAKYITIAPDMMSLALWSQLTRKVSAVMFHGFNTLQKPADKKGLKGTGYICTNEETVKVLQGILKNVVSPLGPVLKRIPERSKKVAILESFTSSMFTSDGGTMGQSGWSFDAHLMLLWANMAPGVIYEEDILAGALKEVRVLVMPSCEVLPRKVYDAIVRFQDNGGILVGDEKLVPSITPDLSINSIKRIHEQPKETKKELAAAGLKLRKALAPYYTPYVASSNEDLVTHVRTSKEADYLFVLNDKRSFGSYWGPYELVAEKGLPNKGTLTLQRKNTAVIYDLLTKKEVPFKLVNGKTVLPVASKGGEGKLFLLLPRKIREITLTVPAKAERGKSFPLAISILDEKGKIAHIHPIHLEVKDPAGVSTDDTTSAALENGIWKKDITLPLNGKKGLWTITASDLASGRKVTRKITVK